MFFKFSAKGKQAKMSYYLGHSDSCQGDSGGPLWQYIGKILHLSRGMLNNSTNIIIFITS